MRLLTAAIDCAGHLVALGRLLRFSLVAREMARFLEGVAEHDLRLSTQTGLQIHPSVGEWGRSPLGHEMIMIDQRLYRLSDNGHR
jgi:hypothetical protein